MKKIVYLSNFPLTSHIEKAWYFSELINSGAYIEYWDLTKLFFPNNSHYNEGRNYIKIFNAYSEFKREIQSQVSDVIYIFLFDMVERNAWRIFRLMKVYQLSTAIFCWGNFPIKVDSKSRFQRLLSSPGTFLGVVLDRIIYKLSIKLHLIAQFDTVFYAGELSIPINPKQKKVAVNFLDYEIYNLIKIELLEDHKYVIFIDQNLPFHQDLSYAKLKALDAKEYYGALNKFFSDIEVKLSVRVIIAAHPRSNYNENYFGDREIVKGKTAELIAGCVFVITHHSTAISYAVLGNKPIIFIYTDAMLKIYRNSVVKATKDIAEYLGAPCICIDSDGVINSVPSIEYTRYINYKYGYLTSHSSEYKKTIDILIEAFGLTKSEY